ncbi:hypothetical protein BRC91_02955 [Halobacteriales archaeon QS_4_62_28]|nr:MAG: hypothetical protein BRC91_02955 [Halobacteriales archaeon QS_4_62_28]
MRRPLDPNGPHHSTGSATVRGTAAFLALLAGTVFVASYPLITGSVVFGGLATATLYRYRLTLGRRLGVVTRGHDRTDDGAIR